MTERVCDFCGNKAENIVLYCPLCNVIFCDICYNGTCGGICRFISSSGIHHYPYHGEMSLLQPDQKLDAVLIEKDFFLSCKTYISIAFKNRTKTILNFNIVKNRLTSYALEIQPKKEKKRTSSIMFSGLKTKCLKYIHSDEEDRPIESSKIRALLLDKEHTITYKTSSFGLLLRELLESLDYPDSIIEDITTDTLTLFSVFKFVTFRCITSPYSLETGIKWSSPNGKDIESKRNEGVTHIPNILIIWAGIEGETKYFDSEESRIIKLKNMVAPYKGAVGIQRSGVDYTLSVTMQCINLE
jgi:hypothetical protein